MENKEASGVPDLDALPDLALLTRKQLQQITGFANITLRVWAAKGRGPRVSMVDGNPRYFVRDVRSWLEASRAAA